MKPPPTIHLSRLKPPSKGRAPRTVNYLQGFWINLYWDARIKAGETKSRLTARRPVLRASSPLSFKRAAFSFFIIPFLAYCLWPAPMHIVYADPITPLSLPDGIKPLKPIKEPSYALVSALEPIWINNLRPYGTYSNNYAPGQCTYGVASRLPVPNSMGNANQWDDYARATGMNMGAVPKEGAIAQTDGDSWAGHVAVVESVNPDGSFVIWEENGAGGAFSTDTRTTTTAEFGTFIYV